MASSLLNKDHQFKITLITELFRLIVKFTLDIYAPEQEENGKFISRMVIAI